MDTKQIALEMNQLHIEHARQLMQIAALFSSGGEAGVLLWLGRQTDEVFSTDIIEHFGLTPGRVANIVKKLEERGFIQRKINYEDLRRTYITLTEAGYRYAEQLYDELTEKHINIIEALGDENAADAVHLLQKTVSVIEKAQKFA